MSGVPCMDPRRRGVVQVERAITARLDDEGDTMHDEDLDLGTRLSALEASAPAVGEPPGLPSRRRRGRFAVSMAMAPIFALVLVATAAAGAVVISNIAVGHPGIENPGQPLAGAQMECMTPPQAAAFLAQHGFLDVDWQVESGSISSSDGSKGSNVSVHQSSPPQHGYVVPGALLENGQVIMVIDQRTGAAGVGACFGQPMP